MKVGRLIPSNCLTQVNYPTVLASTVSSFVSVRGGIVGGRSEVKYVIDKFQNLNTNLTINNEYVSVYKNTQVGFDRLEPSVRSHSLNLIPSTVEYDLRAFLYALGRRMGLLAIGMPINTECVDKVIPVSTAGFIP